MATSRPSRVSRARYTSPMPPAPRGATISYGPSRVPGVRLMERSRLGPRRRCGELFCVIQEQRPVEHHFDARQGRHVLEPSHQKLLFARHDAGKDLRRLDPEETVRGALPETAGG